MDFKAGDGSLAGFGDDSDDESGDEDGDDSDDDDYEGPLKTSIGSKATNKKPKGKTIILFLILKFFK